MDPIVQVAFENEFAVLTVDEKIPLWKVLTVLNERIETHLEKLSSMEVLLVTGARSLASGDVHKLFFQAVNKYNLNIVRVFGDAPDLDAKTDLPVPVEEAAKLKSFLTRQDVFETRAVLFIKRTVRAGQTIEFDGHVVVYGNVNPGAAIRASGNVTVFGKLGGNVWAGCHGNAQSFIVAREFDPIQLRIADFGLPGDDVRKKVRPGQEVIVVLGGGLEPLDMDSFIRG